MGYSTSIKAVQRVEPYLEKLVAAQDDEEIVFPVDDPSKFSMALRTAFSAAARHAIIKSSDGHKPLEPYASYANIPTRWIIKTESRQVRCVPRNKVPIMKLRETLAEIVVPEIDSVLAAIGAVLRHKDKDEIHLPDLLFVNIALQDIVKLRKFVASQNRYIHVRNGAITVSKKAEGAWQPSPP